MKNSGGWILFGRALTGHAVRRGLSRGLCFILALLLLGQMAEPIARSVVEEPAEEQAWYAPELTYAERFAILAEDIASEDLLLEDAEYIEMHEPDGITAEELTASDIAGEIVELREADTKHFRLHDGSYVAVLFESDVHFFDEETEEWIEIDNRLAFTEDTDDSMLSEHREAAEEDEELSLFAPENNYSEIEISAVSDAATPEFFLSHAGFTIALNLLGAETREAEIIEEERTVDPDCFASAVTPRGLTSRIIYREILPGVDLEYVFCQGGLSKAL